MTSEKSVWFGMSHDVTEIPAKSNDVTEMPGKSNDVRKECYITVMIFEVGHIGAQIYIFKRRAY